MAQPSAAGQIWPHLPQSPASEVERRQTRSSDLAKAMYPRPKIKPTNPYRESLLRNLRELNARIRERRGR
jgi:hypothetical protein